MSVHTEHIDDHDIYRGEPPFHDDVRSPGTAPSVSSLSTSTSDSSSSSSSSSSFLAGRRLGAIAAKLELAIARWGRNVRGASSVSSGSSTTSSSSSSSCSSIVTLTKSQIARRRRRNIRSVSSLRTNQSERDIAAHITRMKALERSRQIPRKFALYLPPSIMPTLQQLPHSPAGELISRDEGTDRRITWTTSLPLVLNQLDLATRRPGRNHHKNRPRAKRAQSAERQGPPSEFYFENQAEAEGSSSLPAEPTFTAAARRGKKGKHRAVSGVRGMGRRPKHTTIFEEPQAKPEAKPEAWFLDVANPTWADLRAIGKVLHIHPLTLEDILQQDPREKLEIFSKLGYYFISFRAIETQSAREKLQREAGLKDTLGFLKNFLEDSSIGEANVYLAVFKDGICCFHFTDVSEHTDRVRNRMVLLEQVINMSSDWIAHDILDSIVDSFFPFLQEIEKEITAIDNIVYHLGDFESASTAYPTSTIDTIKPPVRGSSMLPSKSEPKSDSQQTCVTQPSPTPEKGPDDDKEAKDLDAKANRGIQKYYTPAEKLREAYRPRFVSPRLSPRLLYRRVKRHVGNAWRALWWTRIESNARQRTLRRMARTRKLVTVLGRLLATKSDVVTQIRKRLTKAGAGMHGSEELEVAIYMGDVQDHILTLQNALAHYERVLSQSHPTYLAQLRSESENAKGGMDTNLLLLSIVSIGALCVQPLLGLFSLNITIPTNLPGPRFDWFGIVLALSSIIVFSYARLVRYWWRRTRKRMTGI